MTTQDHGSDTPNPGSTGTAKMGSTGTGADTPATPPAPPAVSSRSLNLWTFLTVLAVMTALVIIVWKVLDASTPDSTVAVLGVIIPMFATVGAAVFGIPIAYQRGSETGAQKATATKDQEIAAATDTAAKDGETHAKEKVEPLVGQLTTSVSDLLERIRSATESPQGTDDHRLAFVSGSGDVPPAAVIPGRALTDVERNTAKLQAMVSSLGS